MKAVLVCLLLAAFTPQMLFAQDAAAQSAEATPVLDRKSLYWKGGENCVPVVEYLDFQCPFCRANHPDINQVLEKFGDSVCFYVKLLPVNKSHRFAFVLAAYYEAIQLQSPEAARRFHDIAFEKLEAPGGLDYVLSTRDEQIKQEKAFFEQLNEATKTLGVDMDRLQIDWQSDDIRLAIESDVREAVSLGARATPFFWVDGTTYSGQQSGDALSEAIQSKMHEGH